VYGFFDVLASVLVAVTADVFDRVSLAEVEAINLAEMGWLYIEVFIVTPAYLLF
jgi:hypothetical protein